MRSGDFGDLTVPPGLIEDEKRRWPWQDLSAAWGTVAASGQAGEDKDGHGRSFAVLEAAGALDGALPRDFALMLVPVLAGIGLGVGCFHALSSTTVTRSVLTLVTASGLA